MRIPSVQTIVVTYNGQTFVRDKKSGYYLSSKPIGLNGKRIQLHRYIYEVERGAIPDGYVVHHIDHNKDHNYIENFELVLASVHSSRHTNERINEDKEDYKRRFLERTQDKAKEWHKSEEGIAWHKEHAKTSICKPQEYVTMICQNCGKEYKVGERFAYKSKYCCRNCKASARRKRVRNENNKGKVS